MNNSLFSINNFNVIEDDENYYIFRALNEADHEDIWNEEFETGKRLEKIRTNSERYEENYGTPKYNKDSEITLEEIYDHTKLVSLKQTNCISLTSNANVALDYGTHHQYGYLIEKIPKRGFTNTVAVGDYMLFEIYIKIEEALKNNSIDQNILNIINNIDSAENNEQIKNIVSTFLKEQGIEKDILSRLSNKQYFNKNQQFEYNKIIAKLSILEVTNILPSILEEKEDNAALLNALGIVFADSQVINYKAIEKDEFKFIDENMVRLFAITQQLKEKYPDNADVIALQRKLLELVKDNYRLVIDKDRIVFRNESNTIDCYLPTDKSSIFKEDKINNELLSIENIYNISRGAIEYNEAKKVLDFFFNLTKSKRDVYDYATIVSTLMGNNNLVEQIIYDTFNPNNKIVERSNNKGYKICESVNIGLKQDDETNFPIEFQNLILNIVQEQSYQELNQILDNNIIEVRNGIIKGFIESSKKYAEREKNEFYASAIINTINLKEYYQVKGSAKEKQQQLIKMLSKHNVERLYKAFLKENLSHEQISHFIFNLFIENTFKGKTFAELCELDNIEEYIHNNFAVFNKDVNYLTLNNFLGLFNNKNHIPNSDINLRDFQQRIKNDTDAIYKKGRRFAGIVLPTGGGKSFITMAEMLERKDQKIVYLSPRKEIIRQFKKNIVEYIYGADPEGMSEEQLDACVKDVFPHLDLICYQSLNHDEEEKLANMKADFIIMDEIHHIGGKKWNPLVKRMLDCNPNSQVLGISATPKRDDYEELDGEEYFDMYDGDMMMAMAAYLDDYTPKELREKQYLACNIDVVDAMQEGYVICPNIVSFDYDLVESEEFKEADRIYHKIKDPTLKLKAQKELNKMLDVANTTKLVGVKEVIEDHIKCKDGKYILFIPRKPRDYENSTEEYIKEYIEQMKDDLSGIDDNPHFEFIFSSRGDKENENAMKRFELDNSNHMKIIIAIDMLNEGVHLPNMSGSFNFRKIDKNHEIMALQHLGRVVFSADPDKQLTEEQIPVVFDKYNNYANFDMERLVNKKNAISDLEKLKNVAFWIDKYGRYPELSSNDKDEQRKAVTIKHIQEKYSKYCINGFGNEFLTEYEKYSINQIIDISNKYELWDIKLGEISRKELRKIERINVFNVSASKQTFIEACNSIKDIAGTSALTTKERLERTIKILDILAENNIELSPQTIKRYGKIEELLSKVDEGIKEDIIFELQRLGITTSFELGPEYYMAREYFAQNALIFQNYDYDFDKINELHKYGILKNGFDLTFIDENNFIVLGPHRIHDINIYTGTKFDKDGYDCDRNDHYCFNKDTHINALTNTLYDEHNFDYLHINKDTKTQYDIHNFDIDGINKNTKTKFDERGFTIDGIFYEKDLEGNYESYSGKHYDNLGLDIDGYNRRNFDKNGIHRITKLPYDERGFDKDGYFWTLTSSGKRIKTTRKYDNEKYDCEGNILEISAEGKVIRKVKGFDKHGFDRNGIHINTKTPFDERGFDVNGIWYYKDESGNYVSSESLFDNKGWNIDKMTVRTNVYGFNYDKDGNLLLDFVDDNGFDVYGAYHYPEPKIDKNGFTEPQFNNYIKYRKNVMYKNKMYGRFYDIHGFDRNGINKETRTFLDENNFDRMGYWWKEVDGKLVNTYSFVNDENWTIDKKYLSVQAEGILVYSEIDKKGFNIQHFYKPYKGSKNNVRYDEHGFDYLGINSETGTFLNPEDFDCDGYWWKEENGEKVKTDSKFDSNGWSINHVNKKTLTIRDEHGFDYRGLYLRKKTNGDLEYTQHDKHGFDYKGIHKTTKTNLNSKHFDIDGFWYKKIDGKYVNTGQKYDDKGYTIDRLDERDFSQNGHFRGRRKRYNPNGFDVNGNNINTGESYDIYGKTENGEVAQNADWDKIRQIKEQLKREQDEIKFNKRLYMKDLIPKYDENGDFRWLLESYDEYTDEFEEDSLLEDFINYVYEYGVKENEELYTREEIIELVKKYAQEAKRKERYEESYDIYRNRYLEKMLSDGEISQERYDKLTRAI